MEGTQKSRRTRSRRTMTRLHQQHSDLVDSEPIASPLWLSSFRKTFLFRNIVSIIIQTFMWTSIVVLFTLLDIPLLLLRIVPCSLQFHRRCEAQLVAFMACCVDLIIEKWGRIRLVFQGDNLPRDANYIVFANHRGFLDSFIIHSYLIRKDMIAWGRFVAKQSVRYVPGFGSTMWVANYPMISRSNATKDVEAISKWTRRIMAEKSPFTFTIFPEGTRRTPEKLARSQQFEESNGHPVLSRVMHPRTKGFVALIEGLRNGHLDGVVDITFGYENDTPPTPWDIARGVCDAKVTVHTAWIPVSEMPISGTAEELGDWLRKRYETKEKLLEYFEKQKKFPGGYRPEENVSWGWPLSKSLDVWKKKWPGDDENKEKKS